MGAPQVVEDSLQELMDALNLGHRAVAAVEEAEAERTRELHRQAREIRRRAFEQGRRAGYAQGLEDGRKLTRPERDAIYAAGFAEGASLASKRGVGR